GQHGAIEEKERRRGERRQTVSLGDGQILGHHFAQHYVKETDGQEGEEEAPAVKVGGDERRVQRRGQPHQNVVDGVLAGPPQAKAGQGDTHLGHGKQTARVGWQIERRLRAGIAFRGHLAEPRMAHREQRHLGARKEAVDDDQQYDEQQANGRFVHRFRNYSSENSNQTPGNASFAGNQVTPLRRWAHSRVSAGGRPFFVAPPRGGL